MTKNSKNIVIVGGGTAGWLTALYAQKNMPENNIFLIESEEIGILGAGEGSVPLLIGLLRFLEISLEDLRDNCKITIKNGIKFANWSSESSHFFHPFSPHSPFSMDCNFPVTDFFNEREMGHSHIIASELGHQQKDYSIIERISEKNKIPWILNENLEIISYNDWSIHFDARLLANYLRNVGESRGIVRKEGIVEEIVSDQDGYIVSLKTNKEIIDTDFVFDCTGFKRLIIGKHFDSEWISFKDSLPAKRAIPFFLESEKDIPPYTESIAMDYGWMWKIPLQHRYGCGYVFDSDFISDDEAKKEIDSLLGFEVESPTIFNFNAGCYKKVWIKNCLAIGLSAGFLEPLEATSIMQVILALREFFVLPNNLNRNIETTRNIFNKKYVSDTNEIVDFLYLHYVTDKTNTDFWKNFKKNNIASDFIKEILNVIEERPIIQQTDMISKDVFNAASYNYILIGNNILKKEMLKKHYKMIKYDKNFFYNDVLNNQKYFENSFLSHDYFVKGSKNEK